jgi:hypothetical protein
MDRPAIKDRMAVALHDAHQALKKFKEIRKAPLDETALERITRVKLLGKLRDEWREAMDNYNEASRLLISFYR